MSYVWDNFCTSPANHNGRFVGTVNYTRDNGDTLNYVTVIGKEGNFNPSASSTRYFQTLVYTHKFNDDVTGVLQSDFGTQENALANGNTARWYGVNSYLYWNMTCRCQWGVNAEWFRDQGGFRVGNLLPSIASPNARGWAPGLAGGNGFDGSFYRFTFGPKYFLTPNLYTRASLVADVYNGKRSAAGAVLPFDNGTKSHQEVGVFDLVYTF